MALSKNKLRTFHTNRGLVPDRSMKVAASVHVRQGSMLGRSSGFVRPLVAGDAFAGFSDDEADNSSGAAGDKSALARREGLVLEDVVGVTGIANEDALVYASDDDTLTLTATANSRVGRVELHVSGTKCWVRFIADGVLPS